VWYTCEMHPDHLTDADLEVLSYCADGLTSHEIARETHKELSTIKSRKSRITRKLGARNIAEAVYMSVGLISDWRERNNWVDNRRDSL